MRAALLTSTWTSSSCADQTLPRIELADVVLERAGTEVGGDLLDALDVDVRQSDVVAVGVQPPPDRLADPASRSRNDSCRH